MLYLSGNEAISYACSHAKVDVATGYPGTPSTDILENLHRFKTTICSWSINEKVALEQAAGVYFAGGTAVCIMKNVGLNVASDPLMTLSYTGGFGALVIISCDDPGAYNSQNEQDNRNYAKFAKIPMLEPATPQEAYDFLFEAVKISKEFDTPVMLRMTTRTSMNKSTMEIPPPGESPSSEMTKKSIHFRKEQEKLIMTPRMARMRHVVVEERLSRLSECNSHSPLNVYHPSMQNKKTLLVASGVSYLYARECFPNHALLKLGWTYPLPEKKLLNIAKDYESILCIEELDPFLEEQIASLGLNVRRKARSFYCGDYTPSRVRRLVEENAEPPLKPTPPSASLPPPTLCSGCPHFTILATLRDLDLLICGDIGCYTLGALSPFYAMHSVLDMGASIPCSTGMFKILPQEEKKRLGAVIGDSTFFHSGLTGLIDAVQNKSNALIFILDNSTTAMTGRQGHPGVGDNLLHHDSPKVDYHRLLEAVGVKNVTTLDPYDWKQSRTCIEEAAQKEAMHVFILKRECALLVKEDAGEKCQIGDNCVRCRDCLRLGCPSITWDEGLKRPTIDEENCTGCGVCEKACSFDAILPLSELEKVKRAQAKEGSRQS